MPEQAMTDPATLWRPAALGGVLYLLAYGLWLLPALAPGPALPDLGNAHAVLLRVQALALVLLAPAGLCRGRGGPGPSLLLAMAPWPLLPVFLLAGGVAPLVLLGGQAALLALALVLWGLVRVADLAPQGQRPTLVALAQALAALALASADP
jgi:hypothetical protein